MKSYKGGVMNSIVDRVGQVQPNLDALRVKKQLSIASDDDVVNMNVVTIVTVSDLRRSDSEAGNLEADNERKVGQKEGRKKRSNFLTQNTLASRRSLFGTKNSSSGRGCGHRHLREEDRSLAWPTYLVVFF